MQCVIKQQRLNYYGSIPLICETNFINNLYKVFNDKHEAFLSLRNVQELENEAATLKDQLLKHINVVNDIKNESNINIKITQWYQEKKNLQLQVSTEKYVPLKIAF